MTSIQIQPTKLPDDGAMRGAIDHRDAQYDGAFVYGVTTTGVYCRPSCSSRRANPKNVRFFADPMAAEGAGFRACKRCRPDSTVNRLMQRMQQLAVYIENHADETLSLERLAEKACLSPTHLQRTFKAALGVSPKEYQNAARLKRLKGRLRAGDGVLEAGAEAGYQSTSRAHEAASRNLGMTPSAYRAGGAGETIAHACRETAMGPLLMAATDRGVCFAEFGRTEAALARLKGEFPNAHFVTSDMTHSPQLDRWIDALDAYITSGAPRPELPIDLRGTAFQIRVWQFLLKIAPGDVVSYGELAAGIGSPKAVRAAASACGANRIAVLIPCHRVLRGDGGLGGYRWGVERKRALLDRERRERAP